MSRDYDSHVRAWRRETCPGKCWRCKQATLEIRLLRREPITSADPWLGNGVQDKTIFLCPQKRQPVWMQVNTDYGDRGGCERGATSVPHDLVDRDKRAPDWF